MYSLIGFLITIGILVTIHELGHYAVARWCGVKVLRFSFGFGPVLWSRRTGPDQTEWALSAVPLGGYVRMLDERDGDPIEEKDLPRAFNRKNVWRRCAIVVAGPLANLLLAVILLSVMYMVGVPGQQPVLSVPPAGTPAAAAGIQVHDRIVAVGGEAVESWQDVGWQITRQAIPAAQTTLALTLERDQRTLEVSLTSPPLAEGEDAEEAQMRLPVRLGLRPYEGRPMIREVVPAAPAALAGLQAEDQVRAVDNVPVFSRSEMIEYIAAGAGQPVVLQILRHKETVPMMVTVTPKMEKDASGKAVARIGVQITADPVEMERLRMVVRYGPVDSIVLGTARTWELTTLSLKMIGRMLIGSASLKNLSGPLTIASVAGESIQAGFQKFAMYLAVISIGLGVLNLLPVPLLDGGHLLYYFAEILRGRPLSERVTEIGQRLGLAFIITLIALALLNDFSRMF